MASEEAATPEKCKIVELEHWFFSKIENLRFQIDGASGKPVVVIPFKKTEAYLSFSAVAKEFAIASDSPDGIMLALVGSGLKYVKGLFPGDPLPTEILTGEASWTLLPKHILLAHQRVAMRLVSLMSANEPTVTDPIILLQMAGDPEVKKKVNEAFALAAVKLGLPAECKEEVIGFVNTLANEMAYIEALRDLFDQMLRMREKIQLARRKYSREPLQRETMDQVARLMEKAVKEYAVVFDEIASHTSEIIEMLRNLAEEIAYIRRHRDDLHVRLLAWQELLAQWASVQVERSMVLTELIHSTHRFLAPRFMTVVDWLEVAQKERQKSGKNSKSVMAWR